VAAEAGLAERTAFIEARLDEGRPYARLWQNGWTAAYAGAGLLHATIVLTSDDGDERVANGVGALRAVTAVTLLRLRANPGRHGADPVRAAGPPGSPERLAAAESLLRAAARHAAERRSLSRHALNLGLNAFFGGLIWAFGDGHDALVSTLVGIAGGEANLLTRSRRPVDDLASYRRRYGGELTWAIEPTADGIALRVRF
jgi:hypothetical protein